MSWASGVILGNIWIGETPLTHGGKGSGKSGTYRLHYSNYVSTKLMSHNAFNIVKEIEDNLEKDYERRRKSYRATNKRSRKWRGRRVNNTLS